MNQALVDLVWGRSGRRCEYCRLPFDLADSQFEIDHVVPKVHHGLTVAANLALACWSCNCHKGTNLSGIDPARNRITRLYNPRKDLWETHFEWSGPVLIGRTPIGRTTIDVLRIDDRVNVEFRRLLIEGGLLNLE